MKKHESLSKGDELLKRVLDECLEEELSFVPSEREIARYHRFSKIFEERMQMLFEQFERKIKKHEIRAHFRPRYGHLAACIVVFCVCGWLFYSVVGPVAKKGAMEECAPAAPEMTDLVTEESAMEEAAPKEDAESEVEGSSAVVVLCSVEVQDDSVLITIANTGTETIQYRKPFELEKRGSDGWQMLSWHGTEEVMIEALEPGMTAEESIDLSVYDVNETEGHYRVIIDVDGEKVRKGFWIGEYEEEPEEEISGE